MKDSLRNKLDTLTARHDTLNIQLSEPENLRNPERLRQLSIELSEISEVVRKYREHCSLEEQLEEAKVLLQDDDQQIQAMARTEIQELEEGIETTSGQLQRLLLPKDPNDKRNIFLEIRAGTGGDEAAMFAGDLYRMYRVYVQNRGWKIETVSEHEGEYGGYKEVILRVIGTGAHSRLKFESGTHRVQRVPKTEAQGRIHTSACTVAVLPETEQASVDINTQDLRVDTYRASGAGGQHVNRTDSAVRITHLPSGIVVECQDERSQHQNRARAMTMLRTRLLQAEIQKQHDERSETRRLMVGSGDRSERIRTYNFPQSRVTDHRINLTLYRLEEFIGGDMDQVIDPLTAEHQAALMADMEMEGR
ncbi:MAG: peptide chain release factor 1 [Acidiferrobacterales bacterium]|nr:peptide chain release factor 1 [Acidiferrobacterales bacterium]